MSRPLGKDMTEKQKAVYEKIKNYINNNGYAPTRQELADSLKISTQAISCHIGYLRRKGKIDVIPLRHRGIKING